MVEVNVEIRKRKNVPYSRSSVCASWHGFSALLESWTHCYCLGFLRMERDKNSSFQWGKNLPLLYLLISTTVLSLAQYRCLTEHWEKYRHMRQIQRQHQIWWSFRTPSLLFLSSPIFQKWLPIYLNHSIMLALCCNTFLVALALFFSINSFAYIYLLHLH